MAGSLREGRVEKRRQTSARIHAAANEKDAAADGLDLPESEAEALFSEVQEDVEERRKKKKLIIFAVAGKEFLKMDIRTDYRETNQKPSPSSKLSKQIKYGWPMFQI